MCLAEGQPRRALAHLKQARQPRHGELAMLRIQSLLVEALARRACGQPADALRALGAALALAAPGRLRRSFLDEGAPMLELLRRAAAGMSPFADDAASLASAFQDRGLEIGDWRLADDAPISNLQAPVIEMPTAREREVLELLAAGHSNRELAAALGIA